jgi:hypothetical protein
VDLDFGAHQRLRLRETYIRDVLAVQVNAGAVATVKLDLVLRSLAQASDETGVVPARLSWEDLHDLCRPGTHYVGEIRLKRQWVGEKLARLERMNLLAREGGACANRPRLVPLRDDGSGRPFDDAGNSVDSYATFLVRLIEHERFQNWGAAELTAYFAAMIAERYARQDEGLGWINEERQLGGGVWFRSLDWFRDSEGRRPPEHIRIPFSERTLRRGFAELKRQGLVASKRMGVDPRTGKRFGSQFGRYVYLNGFDDTRDRRPELSGLLRGIEAEARVRGDEGRAG